MSRYNLDFISDEDLFNHVKEIIQKYRFNITLKEFSKNIIDPIKLTFDAKIYQKSIKELIESESLRQMDKSNSNHIGYFHQNIFKYIVNVKTKKSDWIVPKEGFDVENLKDKIYVEMKNKHNTMNAASSKNTYIKMQGQILKEPNATCMLVEVIAKKSQNIPWVISIDKQQQKDERIRRVSIDKFYHLVTGKEMAFKQLVEILPIVIDDVLKDIKRKNFSNSVLEELYKIDKNILKSLYLLSFKTYEGFDDIDIEEIK